MKYPRIEDKHRRRQVKEDSMKQRIKLFDESESIEEYQLNCALAGFATPWYKDFCMLYYYMVEYPKMKSVLIVAIGLLLFALITIPINIALSYVFSDNSNTDSLGPLILHSAFTILSGAAGIFASHDMIVGKFYNDIERKIKKSRDLMHSKGTMRMFSYFDI